MFTLMYLICFYRYDPVFHVQTYARQYGMKMEPISCESLRQGKFWPPLIKNRVGRNKRSRREQPEPADEEERAKDKDLPQFSKKPNKKKIVKCCTLCGRSGHYAPTCHKPDLRRILQGNVLYEAYISKHPLDVPGSKDKPPLKQDPNPEHKDLPDRDQPKDDKDPMSTDDLPSLSDNNEPNDDIPEADSSDGLEDSGM